jgi:hypothetical protein
VRRRIMASERSERRSLINQLEWNSGGYGFGVCALAASLIWGNDHPTKTKPDLKGIVAVCGKPGKYTTEELRKIVEFSKLVTARYDELFRYRRGCNLILLDKREDGHWMRKRLSWTEGPMYSATLEEAMKVFTKELA